MEQRNSAEQQWKLFEATGSIYHYLGYKSYQQKDSESKGECNANSDHGAGSAAGQGGGSGPDPYDPYA